ncbi:arginyltransferase [Methylovorus sp. MP688]|jgi:leucyl-tRNA---protein transferase|uniref:arginyltransferase n=1 Tax=Methylovorus sp. (strain MP688) TaxID=887061 RepID=UPI0001EC4614|nr:arginyltransferase [Methylovorus sp. MP688]ADQ84329.1 Arginyltransferase [Methylovorus sp. MP688]
MTLPNDIPLQSIQFYTTTSYPCGYLENRSAQSLIAAPHHLINANIYSGLIQLGFRRSGKFAYRPQCGECQACIPVRLLVDQFKPNRSQKRAFKQHLSLQVTIQDLHFSEEHFQLYQAYQIARHSGQQDGESDTETETKDQYRNFLVQSNVNSRLIEFRQDGILKMVSVVDIVHDGISAVYTFYDASEKGCSYGTFNVIWLSAWCHSLELPYLYLGYWIKQSQKMAYKQNFTPQQALINGDWQDMHFD